MKHPEDILFEQNKIYLTRQQTTSTLTHIMVFVPNIYNKYSLQIDQLSLVYLQGVLEKEMYKKRYHVSFGILHKITSFESYDFNYIFWKTNCSFLSCSLLDLVADITLFIQLKTLSQCTLMRNPVGCTKQAFICNKVIKIRLLLPAVFEGFGWVPSFLVFWI